MVMNGRIHDLILDPERTHEIIDIVSESGFYGMQTFDQALLHLFRGGLVSLEDARAAASNQHDFELALRQEGLQPVS
jgi:twitching motility protein PilT